MGKHLDKNKVEQAFRKAEKTLASGDKDARAGRFIVREADSGRFVRKDKQSTSPKKG